MEEKKLEQMHEDAKREWIQNLKNAEVDPSIKAMYDAAVSTLENMDMQPKRSIVRDRWD